MKKIPKKFAPLLGAFLMSLFMAFMMTFFVTALNVGVIEKGFPENFIDMWMHAFSRIIFIVFPVILTVRPLVEKLVKKITE